MLNPFEAIFIVFVICYVLYQWATNDAMLSRTERLENLYKLQDAVVVNETSDETNDAEILKD